MSTRKKRIPGKDKWEALLKEVTLKENRNEILCDPFVLDTLAAHNSNGYTRSLFEDSRLSEEREEQLRRVQRIAREKLRGMQRECILLLFAGYDSYSEIAERLEISRNTVHSYIREATQLLKAHIEGKSPSHFPSTRNQRYRTVLFALDTLDEQKEFQAFLNTHQIFHLALSSGHFHKALVVYR